MHVVVLTAGLPDGWAGKPWAMWCGANEALRDVVVFLDADDGSGVAAPPASPHPRPWRWLVSIQPYHRTGRIVERLSALFNVVAVMGVGFAPARVARQASAFGPCPSVGARFLAHGTDAAVPPGSEDVRWLAGSGCGRAGAELRGRVASPGAPACTRPGWVRWSRGGEELRWRRGSMPIARLGSS